jgi:phage tail-like protein
MPDSSSNNNIWTLSKFHFSVDIGDHKSIMFQEVTGLSSETQVIEYREGNSKSFSTIKMPGVVKVGNVNLKRGVFTKENAFWDWYNKTIMNTIASVPVVIRLLDEAGNPAMAWTLQNAWVTKITGNDFKSDGNEIAVEEIEFAHEGLTVANS